MKSCMCEACHCLINKNASVCRICGNDTKLIMTIDSITHHFSPLIKKINISVIVILIFSIIFAPISTISSIIFIISFLILAIIFLAKRPILDVMVAQANKTKERSILKIVSQPILSLSNVVLPKTLEHGQLETKMEGIGNKSRIIRDEQRGYKIYTIISIILHNIKIIIDEGMSFNDENNAIIREAITFCNDFKRETAAVIGEKHLDKLFNVLTRMWNLYSSESIERNKINELNILMNDFIFNLDMKEALLDMDKI